MELMRTLLKYLLNIFPGKWEVCIVDRHNVDLKEFVINEKKIAKILKSRFGVYYADPFICETADATWLYLEEYSRWNRKGVIRVFKLNKELQLISSEVLISEAFHLSFPFLFEHKSSLYIIPETHTECNISIFRLINNTKAKKVAETARGLDLVDPIIHAFRGKWFLLASPRSNVDVDKRGTVDCFELDFDSFPKLRIKRYLQTLRGRNAGGIITIDGINYRATQVSGSDYGKEILVKKISYCESEARFEETPFKLIKSALLLTRNVHTFNVSKHYVVFDRKSISLVALCESIFFKAYNLFRV
jgi:hypothetical protein